ncbi:glycosyltransferase [Thauera sp. WB-2]|uniref:glycosyltransferase n=1 Tax=Thauera sp. WB-2 TaxID=2897772 RepID=UPI000ED1AC8E|nr:glycosyltransferase [Thauera sp. WB-2]WBL64826.1 glycosyltransferase [Thauera sp. WB-2]HAG74529.1 glycosyltransferase [Thauera sp.]
MLEKILIWARGATLENAYSRDRVVYRLLRQSGVQLSVFSPAISVIGDIEALIKRLPKADAVWVPSFRQRDIAAASRFARRRGIPLIVDPLISAYDKQVNERRKFPADSTRARKLLAQERGQFSVADIVIADTQGHADYFHEILGVARTKIIVLPVGADESIFKAQPLSPMCEGRPIRVLFYGSFIGLHGLPTIVDAIRQYDGPAVEFRFIGEGPMRAEAERALIAMQARTSIAAIRFEDWLDINSLAGRIAESDIVLGVFGTTGKALRVVPNKVYQALAMGRPVITGDTPAFDDKFRSSTPAAIAFSTPGNPGALAKQIADWAREPTLLEQRGVTAQKLFKTEFAEEPLRLNLMRDLLLHL